MSDIKELPNHEEVFTKISALLEKNPKTNKDVDVFLKSTKKKATAFEPHLPNARDFSVLMIAGFLWKYEGTYMLCVDVICYMLVATGHDLFNPFRRKYVDSIEEIGEVDVSTKLKFLDRHDSD